MYAQDNLKGPEDPKEPNWTLDKNKGEIKDFRLQKVSVSVSEGSSNSPCVTCKL